jgi:hypothetical protein
MLYGWYTLLRIVNNGWHAKDAATSWLLPFFQPASLVIRLTGY